MASGKEGATIGPYRIVEQIGQGGMATVYKAYQASMDRYIALKILPAYYARDPRFVQRFAREARTIARLEHKNILPVYDYGEENGITYLAMRYLEGSSLKEVLALGMLTLGDAGQIIEQVCAALDYAHRQGVVHRDVKPANILVDTDGEAYLMDFGIAKVLEGTAELTAEGGVIGTPAYMAPEQSLAKGVDARTDIYALGVILYEIVVGRAPYQADTPMAVALAHIHEPLPIPHTINPEVPEGIERVILKALAKDPEERYQTANEMSAALHRALVGEQVDRRTSTLMDLAIESAGIRAGQVIPVDELPPTMDVPLAPPAQTAPAAPVAAPVKRKLPGWVWIAAGAAALVVIGGLIIGLTGDSPQEIAKRQTAAAEEAVAMATQIVETRQAGSDMTATADQESTNEALDEAKAERDATSTQSALNRGATQTVVALTPTVTPTPDPLVVMGYQILDYINTTAPTYQTGFDSLLGWVIDGEGYVEEGKIFIFPGEQGWTSAHHWLGFESRRIATRFDMTIDPQVGGVSCYFAYNRFTSRSDLFRYYYKISADGTITLLYEISTSVDQASDLKFANARDDLWVRRESNTMVAVIYDFHLMMFHNDRLIIWATDDKSENERYINELTPWTDSTTCTFDNLSVWNLAYTSFGE